jgi:2-polyprenyl-3-methyl-5-hydroxy-6-metoxy-1,4-benzoquinol methylase
MKALVAGSAFHEKLADGWSARYSHGAFRRRYEFILRQLPKKDVTGQAWLDAGCGSGVFSRALAAMGARVIGVDASPAMLAEAQRSSQGDNTPAQFALVESLEHVPVDSASMDGVVCLSVLEYVPDPGRCLQELHRVLRPGGVLIVTVPNARSLLRGAQQVVRGTGRLFGKDWCGYLTVSRNTFTAQAFRRRLALSGFAAGSTASFSPYAPALLNPTGLGGLWLFAATKAL